MIASLRGVLVLAALAVVLAIAAVVFAPSTRDVEDRALASDFTGAATAIVIARPGEAPVELTHTERDGWRSSQPAFTAEPAAIDALVTALRGATWHRRAPASVAGPIRAEVTVRDDGGTWRLAIGRDVAGAEQTWIVRGEQALLVDAWVARALAPEPLALRIRHPLAAAPFATSITAGSLELAGDRLVRPQPLWLDPALVHDAAQALADLEMVSLAIPPGAHAPGEPRIEVRAASAPEQVTVAAAGTCTDDRVLLSSTTGDGCVERAAWDRVLAALAALSRPPQAIADPRPLPITPVRLVLADGTPVELAGLPRVGDEDADPERVRALVAALASPAEVVARPTTRPTGSLVGTDRHGVTVTLELFAGGVLARAGEPVALRPNQDAWALVVQPASALRDPVLWREDATTLTSIAIDGVTYRRGAVLGEWTREPAGPADPALVDAAASALATVRAPRGPAPARTVHSVAVTFTPPAGAPTHHRLDVGRATADGCPARVDGAPVRLELGLCTAIYALGAVR